VPKHRRLRVMPEDRRSITGRDRFPPSAQIMLKERERIGLWVDETIQVVES
jgi:hypothetical protein